MDVNEWQRFCRTGSVRSYLRYKNVRADEQPKNEGKHKNDEGK